ncbi:MAG TPA: pantoate--beta-alanine ligase [Solirubrobacteraceae bacterium]|nr:pantoate--beta-alanine ligase [Solirubrobacteraceae bacterium]
MRTVTELRSALAPVRQAALSRPTHAGVVTGIGGARVATRIGLVPTMGALHEGHLSLIRCAREQCDVVVVSLFVNPAQFDEGADLELYPRREADDARLAERAGADILFVPAIEEVYPEGFSTAVEVFGLTGRLEGASRGASHFRGVTTVVTKLLNMVSPDIAYFGQKDAQQVAVIKRMVADLDIPVGIVVCPTERERDGLAMSSRNARLDPDQRTQAGALFESLEKAADLARAGEHSAEQLVRVAHETLVARGVEPEYLELVDPLTFERIDSLAATALLVVAARVGAVRLIDNEVLQPAVVHTAGVADSSDSPTSHLPTGATTCSA